MKVASIFSGIGALDMGLQQAGHEIILMCEKDPVARQILSMAFPGTLIEEDVTRLVSLPKETTCLAAGFPCIDVSRAGKRIGLNGPSTGLVHHIFRLLRRFQSDYGRPVPWVLLENVQALLDRRGKDSPAIEYILNQFMELGYGSWAYRVISSSGFGLPNKRKRVFIIASLDGDARDVLLAQGPDDCVGACQHLFDGRRCFECHRKYLHLSPTFTGSYAVDLGNAISAPCEDVAPTFTTNNSKILLLMPNGKPSGMLRIEDAERLQGLPKNWTAVPNLNTSIFGKERSRPLNLDDTSSYTSPELSSFTKRWELIGNAVTVHVSRWLGERLAMPYSYKYHFGIRDKRMTSLFGKEKSKNPQSSLSNNISDTYSTMVASDQPMNIWSFVTLDNLQEAVIFSYDRAQRTQELSTRKVFNICSTESGQKAVASYDETEERDTSAIESETIIAISNAKADLNCSGKSSEETDACIDITHASKDLDSVAMDGNAAALTEECIEKTKMHEVSTTSDEEEDEILRNIFQAELVEASKRGRLANAPRQSQKAWDKDSWPKCAWWVKGLGAFAVPNVSESPVLTPFQPLGNFIEEVGRVPSFEEIESYVHRMRERGFELSVDLQQRLFAATNEAPNECAEIIRIPGLLSDAGMCGEIVWVKDPTHQDRSYELYWPAEILDPHNMPQGISVPVAAIEKLKKHEFLASFPCSGNDCPCHHLHSISQPEESPFNGFAPSSTEENNIGSILNHPHDCPEHRRILAVFLPLCGSHTYVWIHPSEAISWEHEGNIAHESARIAIKTPSYPLKEELKRAIRDAKASLALRKGIESEEVVRIRRTRAAVAAAGVDLKRRCGRCQTCCSNAGSRQYDCLSQRMQAAALSGHGGAQLAVCREDALGAKIEVWWDGDKQYYPATVANWDPASTEHTVAYDDGEVSSLKLWQHSERIRVLNDPKEWADEAKKLQERMQEYKQYKELLHKRTENPTREIDDDGGKSLEAPSLQVNQTEQNVHSGDHQVSCDSSFPRCQKYPYCSKKQGHVARCNQKLLIMDKTNQLTPVKEKVQTDTIVLSTPQNEEGTSSGKLLKTPYFQKCSKSQYCSKRQGHVARCNNKLCFSDDEPKSLQVLKSRTEQNCINKNASGTKSSAILSNLCKRGQYCSKKQSHVGRCNRKLFDSTQRSSQPEQDILQHIGTGKNPFEANSVQIESRAEELPDTVLAETKLKRRRSS